MNEGSCVIQRDVRPVAIVPLLLPRRAVRANELRHDLEAAGFRVTGA